LDRLRASFKGEGLEYTIRYDSDGEKKMEARRTDSLAGAIVFLDKLRAAKYRLRIKPDGNVVELKGFDKVIADLPEDNLAPAIIGLNLHDDTYRWYLQRALGVLPTAKVMEGSTCKDGPLKMKLTDFGELSGKVEYRLDKPAKSGAVLCQVVRFKGSQVLDLHIKKWPNSSKSSADQPVTGTLKISKADGVIRFNLAAGAVHDSEYETVMSGDLRFGTDPGPVRLKHKVTWQAK
jgi:hypothetical protein